MSSAQATVTPITHSDSVFAQEEKLSDNLFLIQLKDDNSLYCVRLYPFAVFEVTNRAQIDQLALGQVQFEEIAPFSYMQPLLILTTQCNLACTYCYAHEGSYGMKEKTMPLKVIQNTVEYLRRIVVERYLPSVTRYDETELGLICFGGEPLITVDLVKKSHEMLQHLCEELNRTHGTRFSPTLTINTNGYQLKESTLSYLTEHARDIEVVVSYDGTLHDQSRITKTGKGTRKKVLANIRRLHNAGVDVSVTTCVLPEMTISPSLFTGSLGELYNQGISVNPSFIRGPLEGVSDRTIYPALVQQSYDKASLDLFGDVIAEEISKGAQIYSRRYRRRLLEGGYRYRCGAGSFEFAVTPNGAVYPCHNFVSEKYRLGNMSDSGFDIPKAHPIIQKLLHRTVQTLEPCKDCVFQSTCMSSFDCPAHSLQDLHDINLVDKRFCGFARKVQHAILSNFILEMKHGHS